MKWKETFLSKYLSVFCFRIIFLSCLMKMLKNILVIISLGIIIVVAILKHQRYGFNFMWIMIAAFSFSLFQQTLPTSLKLWKGTGKATFSLWHDTQEHINSVLFASVTIYIILSFQLFNIFLHKLWRVLHCNLRLLHCNLGVVLFCTN